MRVSYNRAKMANCALVHECMVLLKWARIFLLSCKNGKNGDWSEYFIDDSFSYLHSNRFLISLHCRAILLCLKNIWISVPSHTPVMREILLGFGLTLVSFLYLLWICMYSPQEIEANSIVYEDRDSRQHQQPFLLAAFKANNFLLLPLLWFCFCMVFMVAHIFCMDVNLYH